uniref:retinol dehydrogenase 13-like isoform X2 n=1 Tax=Myxine glutinosa TaxID=7769 RepID=UPI00358F72CA
MNRYLFRFSVMGTIIGGTVILKDYLHGGQCPSKARMDGKTIVITGANTGIGKKIAAELATRGGRVILACRDMDKCESAARGIRRDTLNRNVVARKLDLASFASIRNFAMQIEEGHYLLTNLLLDKLLASAPSRIINVSSMAYIAGKLDPEDLQSQNIPYNPKMAYCRSKMAGMLFTYELSRRLNQTGVTVNAVNPGVAASELGRHTGLHQSNISRNVLGPFFWLVVRSPEQAAQPSIYLAVSEKLEGISGRYFDGMRPRDLDPEVQDDHISALLWEASRKFVGLCSDNTQNLIVAPTNNNSESQ